MNRKRNRIISIVLLIVGVLFVAGTCAFLTIRPDMSAFKEKVASVFTRDTAEEEPEEEETEEVDEAVEAILSGMTLEQKAAQLFIIEPEQITGMSQVIAAGDTTKAAISEYPVGGFIYTSQNLIDPDQAKEMMANVKSYSEDTVGVTAFISIAEEGGTVSELAENEGFSIDAVSSAQEIGTSGSTENAASAGTAIGTYLSELGFNMNFAPYANVLTDENAAMAARVFGSDAETVSSMVTAEADAMETAGILPVIGNFPQEASSDGSAASSQKSVDELKETELVPFAESIENGAAVIKLSNTAFSSVTGDSVPASLSEDIVTGLLREELGFNGLIVTDALNESAVTGSYTSAQAAVLAIQAGADVILMPDDFYTAYQGILAAVESGEITEDRIDESVRRILDVKINTIGQ